MDQPLISIIIPVYNVEKYLSECLDSVASQTYTNIEVIMVDDGSTDNSHEICQSYVNADKRFYLYTKKNGGLPSAWNTGLSHVKGSWVMFVDSDDKVDHDIVKKLLAASNDDVDIVSCCCQVLLNDSIDEDHFFSDSRMFSSFNEKQTLLCQLMDFEYEHPGKRYTAISVCWGKLYRTSLLKNNGIVFDESLLRMQDMIFNMYTFYYANQVLYIDEPLYLYRYDNLSGFLANYADRHVKLYSNLRIARRKAFSDLGLYKYKLLRQKYYEEAIFNMVLVCKYGIFLKKRSLKEQKKMYFDFINKPYFKEVLVNYKKSVNMFSYLHSHPLRCLYFRHIVRRRVLLLHMWGKYAHLFGR